MTDQSHCRLSVVIPVYNNAESLDELIERLDTVCTKHFSHFELVFVNDASSDNSQQKLIEARHRYPYIKFFMHSNNLGQQQAIRSGLRATNGSVVAVMDADLQDNPDDIALMYHHLTASDLEAVFAIRDNDYQNGLRMLSSRIFKYIIRRWVGLPKGAGAFVIMSRKKVRRILAYNTNSFYLSGLVCMAEGAIGSVIVNRSRRKTGRSSYDSGMRLRVAIANMNCLLGAKNSDN